MKETILIDAGTGNLRSVQKALEAVGADVTRTDDLEKEAVLSVNMITGAMAIPFLSIKILNDSRVKCKLNQSYFGNR